MTEIRHDQDQGFINGHQAPDERLREIAHAAAGGSLERTAKEHKKRRNLLIGAASVATAATLATTAWLMSGGEKGGATSAETPKTPETPVAAGPQAPGPSPETSPAQAPVRPRTLDERTYIDLDLAFPGIEATQMSYTLPNKAGLPQYNIFQKNGSYTFKALQPLSGESLSNQALQSAITDGLIAAIDTPDGTLDTTDPQSVVTTTHDMNRVGTDSQGRRHVVRATAETFKTTGIVKEGVAEKGGYKTWTLTVHAPVALDGSATGTDYKAGVLDYSLTFLADGNGPNTVDNNLITDFTGSVETAA